MNPEADQIRRDAQKLDLLLDAEYGIKWDALTAEQRFERLRLGFHSLAHLVQLLAMHLSDLGTELDVLQEARREFEGRRKATEEVPETKA